MVFPLPPSPRLWLLASAAWRHPAAFCTKFLPVVRSFPPPRTRPAIWPTLLLPLPSPLPSAPWRPSVSLRKFSPVSLTHLVRCSSSNSSSNLVRRVTQLMPEERPFGARSLPSLLRLVINILGEIVILGHGPWTRIFFNDP